MSKVALSEFSILALRAVRNMPKLAGKEKLFAAIALASEAGEFANLVKKSEFNDVDISNERFLEELADVAWCLNFALAAFGFKWEEAFGASMEKMRKRHPDCYSWVD